MNRSTACFASTGLIFGAEIRRALVHGGGSVVTRVVSRRRDGDHRRRPLVLLAVPGDQRHSSPYGYCYLRSIGTPQAKIDGETGALSGKPVVEIIESQGLPEQAFNFLLDAFGEHPAAGPSSDRARAFGRHDPRSITCGRPSANCRSSQRRLAS